MGCYLCREKNQGRGIKGGGASQEEGYMAGGQVQRGSPRALLVGPVVERKREIGRFSEGT